MNRNFLSRQNGAKCRGVYKIRIPPGKGWTRSRDSPNYTIVGHISTGSIRVLQNHPSAESIYERLVADYPTMSPATVYKTINLLKKNGEVLELEFSEMSNRYDGNKPYPHPHMICTKCGTILDPPVHDFEKLKSKMSSKPMLQYR